MFGGSAGAVIGLDLSIRHPEQVRVFISREPILLTLRQEQAIQFLKDLQQNHRQEIMKLSTTRQHADHLNDEQKERTIRNLSYFIEHEIPGITQHNVDPDALKAALSNSDMRIVPAGGRESRGFFPYRGAVALAEQLGTEIKEFPGDHVGPYDTNHLKEFAEVLNRVLE